MDKEKIKDILEWIYCIIIAVIIAVIFRNFIGAPTIVKQGSMTPTLLDGQRLWISKLDKTFKELPKRGDIVTFEAPNNMDYDKNYVAQYKKENVFDNIIDFNHTNFIKRVIGLPGEHIVIKDKKIYINEIELKEEYLKVENTNENGNVVDVIVPDNTIYVLGDNRTGSIDSRVFGCIPIEKIEGKAIFRFYPFDMFGKVN